MFGQRRCRDTTEVPKQALNVILDYLFIFFITVSSLHLVNLNNFLRILYTIINDKNCSLSIALTAMDQKLQKS